MCNISELDEVLKDLREVSEDYECNVCKDKLIKLIEELKQWRTNPFRMISQECKARTTAPECDSCPWIEGCEPLSHNMPDSWY